MPPRQTAAQKKAAEAATANGDPTEQIAVDWKPVGAAAKLAFIQTHITFVEKTGVNAHHGYNYFQEHGLLNLIRPMMRELHCAILPSPTGVTYTREGNRAIVVGFIDFIDSDQPPFLQDGESYILDAEGKPIPNPQASVRAYFTNEGVDTQDKATNKALTGWMKYALQKLFAVPTEQIDDADHSEVKEAQAQVASAPVPEGEQQVAPAKAASIKKGLAAMIAAGELDANKMKAMIASFGKSKVADLSDDQANELYVWAEAEQAKAVAARDAGGEG